MQLTEADKGDRFILHKLFEKREFHRPMKEAFFYYEPQRLMIADDKETYVVVSRDMAIAFPLFMDGESDFGKFVTAIEILQKQKIYIRTLWDVGANVGSISIPALRRGFVQKAVAFEPEQQLVRLLRANAILNGVEEDLQCHAVALGESSSSAQLMTRPGNTGDCRIAGLTFDDDMMGEDSMRPQTVQMKRMDAFAADFSVGSTLIFMDIQGYEGKALLGAGEILNSAPPLVVEFWPYGMKRADTYHELRQIVCDGAYKYFANLAEAEPRLQILTAKSLDELYGESEERFDWSTDVLFI